MRRLEDYGKLSDDDLQLVVRVREQLLQECMAGAGFPYVPPAFTAPPSVANRSFYPEDELVATAGYAWRASRGFPFNDDLPPMSAEAQAQLELCGVDVNEVLDLTDLSMTQQVLGNGESEIESRLDAEPDVVAAYQSWSSCMGASGYQFTSPSDAEVAADRMSGGFQSQEAIDQAVVDFRCRREVRLEEIRQLTRTRLTLEWIESNPSIIADLDEAIASVINKAIELDR